MTSNPPKSNTAVDCHRLREMIGEPSTNPDTLDTSGSRFRLTAPPATARASIRKSTPVSILSKPVTVTVPSGETVRCGTGTESPTCISASVPSTSSILCVATTDARPFVCSARNSASRTSAASTVLFCVDPATVPRPDSDHSIPNSCATRSLTSTNVTSARN